VKFIAGNFRLSGRAIDCEGVAEKSINLLKIDVEEEKA
jgi:hypothetical protein